MKNPFYFFTLVLFLTTGAGAEANPPTEATRLAPVTVSSSSAGADFTGFGEAPAWQTPAQTKSLAPRAGERLKDVARREASVSDAYNATGYWDQLAIRGYTLDARTGYFREGLPINAETALAMENKESVEIFKGVAGLQAGVAAPGGVVNLRVRRPESRPHQRFFLEGAERASFLVGADVNRRVGGHGLRVGLVGETLRPRLENAVGSRQSVAVAHDYQVTGTSQLAFEAEWTRRSQPSQAGFSLLGDTIPTLTDPQQNLNDQAWSRPVVFENLFSTLKWTQAWGESQTWSAVVGVQRLKTDDHLAYPFGCDREGRYDRFCADGGFNLYDYRSENERRDAEALRLENEGRFTTGSSWHHWRVGALVHQERERFQNRAYNLVGEGRVDGTVERPEDPSRSGANTNRNQARHDVYLSDRIETGDWRFWAGARQSWLTRESRRTDGSRPTSYRNQFLLPWAGLGYQFTPGLLYLSASSGIESFVTPNKSGYARPGEALTDVRSRQWELGFNSRPGPDQFRAAVFHIERPLVLDQSPVYEVDGFDVHRGLELSLESRRGAWRGHLGTQWLRSARERATIAKALNGKAATNTPELSARVELDREIGTTVLGLRLFYESARQVDVENRIQLPAWARADLEIAFGLGEHKAWRGHLRVENLTDARVWRESPTQYGHIYLYPVAERTLSMGIQAEL